MLVVGLTGGIGSGKSTVADLFAARGVPVIDTDRIARELVEPGLPALEAIRAHFGDAVIGADGRLDRAALRNLVFDDPERRRALEAILHPRIRREVRERIAALDAPYCLVAIPLLVETGQRDLVDRVLVVDAPPDVQLRRTVARDDLSAAQVQAIMASQASRQARLAAADEVIANDRDLAHLQSEVARLHALYRQLSTA